MTIWFDKRSRCIDISWYRKYAMENRKECGTSDPDIRTGMYWGFRSNGAKKGIHSCYDCTLALGYLEIGYTNWNYSRNKKQSVSKVS